jgi:hypothetical protein
MSALHTNTEQHTLSGDFASIESKLVQTFIATKLSRTRHSAAYDAESSFPPLSG